MVSCYRGLLYFVVRASLPLVAGLLCYHGLVLWCVGLQLCHWSLRSARAWVLGAAPGLCPPLGHTVRPRRVGLRPLLHWPRSAARLVVFGRAPVRLACNAPAALFHRAGLLVADGSSLGDMPLFPLCTVRSAVGRPAVQLALAHCESCTAPPRVAVEFNASATHLYQYRTLIRRCYGPRVEASTAGGVQLQQPPPPCGPP